MTNAYLPLLTAACHGRINPENLRPLLNDRASLEPALRVELDDFMAGLRALLAPVAAPPIPFLGHDADGLARYGEPKAPGYRIPPPPAPAAGGWGPGDREDAAKAAQDDDAPARKRRR